MQYARWKTMLGLILIGWSGTGPRMEAAVAAAGASYVLVCEDAGAGAYEAFPDVCRLKDGRLMAVFYAGYGHVALPNAQLPKGGRISFCTSADEGRTWTPAQTLYDGPNDDRDPSIVQLKDGRLACSFFSLSADPEKKPYLGLGSWVIFSSDLGQSWTAPQRLSEKYYCSAPIRELASGRLMLGLYTEENNSARGAVVWSDDQGKTWSPETDIPNAGMRLDAETDVIELRDGRLFAALRADGGKPMAYSYSSDQGRSWTPAASFGFPGHCPYLLRTRDGIILMAHRLPKTSLHYSLDECRTWNDNVVVDEVGGAYPSMVNLKDGSVLIVYYEEGAASSIRAKRFKATRSGIEFLKW